MSKDTQSQKYQLTINNPAEKDLTHEKILKIFIENFKTFIYTCMADEKGTTYHTHVFVCFNSRVRFSTLQKHFPQAHIEKCKGTVSDNIDYIKKSGKWEKDAKCGTQVIGTFEQHGNPPPESKGKRDDMTELYQMVLDGMNNAEIIAQNQDYILYIDAINKLRLTILEEKYRNERRLNLKVTYISGTTGTGKTRGVLERHGDGNVYRVTDYKHPFDSYCIQPVIVFDEFRSSLNIADMLEYLDIYPVTLPARYSNHYACYETAYIISNWSLEEQYTEIQRYHAKSWDSFLRRIHEVQIFNADGSVDIYNSVKDYMNRDGGFLPATKKDDDNPFIGNV